MTFGEAIAALPWVDQLCPFMPHQYAIVSKSPAWAWHALAAIIRFTPQRYRAYFRGYPSANWYWDAPDGLRYWRSGGIELDRCRPDSVEPLRRVNEGATPTPDWDGPRWAPNGSGWYVQDAKGRWWPRFEGTDLRPCNACTHPPKDLVDSAA